MNETKKDNLLKDSAGQYVLLKSHKLAGALYLITDFIADQDPLKWRLRDLSLELVNKLNDLSGASLDSRRLAIVEGAINLISRLTSFLDIGVQNRAVSEMNFSILKQEYLNLRARLETEQKVLHPNLFSVPTSLIEPPQISIASISRLPTTPLGTQSSKGQTPIKDKPVNNDRRESILAFIKKAGWSSIKDISKAVPGYSTKTVQRELLDLVKLGVLKKEGDRRWSRYTLVDQLG